MNIVDRLQMCIQQSLPMCNAWICICKILKGITNSFVLLQHDTKFDQKRLVSVGCFFLILLLLIKVPLIVFLHYGLYVNVSAPLSQLVAFGKNNIHY